MSNPLEGTYGLFVWEVGGSTSEPTDTGRRGDLDEMNEVGFETAAGRNAIELPDGRKVDPIKLAGYVVKPVAEEATDGE